MAASQLIAALLGIGPERSPSWIVTCLLFGGVIAGYWGSTERKTGLAQPKIGRFFCKFKVIKGVGFKLQNSWDWALTSEEALRTEPPQSTGYNGLNHLRNGQPLNPVFRSVDPQYPNLAVLF